MLAVVYFDGCPSWQEAGHRLRLSLDHLGRQDIPVSFVPVTREAEAAVIGFRGSPTLVVDGTDLFPDAPVPGGLSCRVYRTAEA